MANPEILGIVHMGADGGAHAMIPSLTPSLDSHQVLDCSPPGSNSALGSDALTDPKSETLKGPPMGENLGAEGTHWVMEIL